MTRSEKRLFRRTLALGLVLTALVIVADAIGVTTPLDRFLYDARAKHFQYFTKPPTDKIFHLDIDDQSEKVIGRFPWHRTKLAEMIEEIHLAGAKAIGMDILFPETEDVRYEQQSDGTFKAIEDDRNLANAVQRSGNVLIPIATHLIGKDSETLPSIPANPRLMELAIPKPIDLSPILHAESELTVIASLVEATRYSGVVNFLPDSDGIVRSVPLFIDYRGKLMPHMALAAFCATMGVNLADLRITDQSITIPMPQSSPVVVPVRKYHSPVYGNVGMFMDIPQFGRPGKDSWLTAFDWPTYSESRQHLALSKVWEIRQFLHRLEITNREADQAIFAFNDDNRIKERTEFLAKPTDEMRPRMIDITLKELEGLDTASLEKISPDERGKEGSERLAIYKALRIAAEAQTRLPAQIAQARAELRKLLEGHYVLIGWAVTGWGDRYSTSLDPSSPGAAVQGAVFNALATRQFWKSASLWTGPICTFLLGLATTLIVAFLPVYRALIATALLVAGYVIMNGLLFFDYGKLLVPAAGPISSASVIWFGVTVGKIIYEQRERSRITKRFSSYTDPLLVNLVVENPDAINFEGQVKEISVVFTDLVGFTSLSERLREQTVPLLNEYMSLMLPIIRENRGYWNKFLGDGIMFFFNAPEDDPNHARNAVQTVLEMQKAMGAFNQRLLERGLPELGMRAGIATGMMVVGDAGSTHPKHHAADYTVLGDEVNLGARLESANKTLGSKILISARTAELVRDVVLLRPVGTIQVMGKTSGVPVFEAHCLHAEATDGHKVLVELSTQVVEHFRAARFDDCIEAAARLEQEQGQGKFTELYTELARKHRDQPSDGGFDGQIVLSAK